MKRPHFLPRTPLRARESRAQAVERRSKLWTEDYGGRWERTLVDELMSKVNDLTPALTPAMLCLDRRRESRVNPQVVLDEMEILSTRRFVISVIVFTLVVSGITPSTFAGGRGFVGLAGVPFLSRREVAVYHHRGHGAGFFPQFRQPGKLWVGYARGYHYALASVVQDPGVPERTFRPGFSGTDLWRVRYLTGYRALVSGWLRIRVEPAEANVLVGSSSVSIAWCPGYSDSLGFSVEIHRVEVNKAGVQSYQSEVDIKQPREVFLRMCPNSEGLLDSLGEPIQPLHQARPELLKKSKNIYIDSPKLNDQIESPLLVSGSARGSWFFEGEFPVRLKDAEGRVLAYGLAKAQGEWMTPDFVPFKLELTFDPPGTTRGVLVVQKSRQKEGEVYDGFELPIRFREP